ncbi:hypothetical protein BHF71_02385 [Vulcanibacillus modesticaldus]|uniref:Uncharacterized protein n=1 Tax=Vulcanibacillus modesticaldus TaxID=337097 RepID=A0A1D2YTM0_9BACI|nr:DnaD domain protein [Vulcanibacillus modesticaldus]OEF99053.1 hypothetical protein BHF71_02385 [Vulcanibacillus modesticaldus]
MYSNDQLIIKILQDGSTSISNLLLGYYKKIGLTDQDMMVIIHLIHFISKGNKFPSVSELEARMSLSTEELMRVLQRLVRQGYIYIEEHKDQETGVLFEAYNLNPLYYRIFKEIEREIEVSTIEAEKKEEEMKAQNIFKVFEQEFGRPLSPMELEMISTWIDKDKYSEEIIVYALKEAVFSNKLNFRYIDKILFEWQRKNIKTIQQIKEHVKNFRLNKNASKDSKPNVENYTFEFYNWLEENE